MKRRKTWKFEDDSTAVNALHRLYGEEGCRESQYSLGKALITQSQKENDFLKAEAALNWLLKAANLGHRDALITLQACYRNNYGVTSNNRHLLEKCLQRTGKEIKAEIIGHALFVMITDSWETEISQSLAVIRLNSLLVDKQCNKVNEDVVIVDDKTTINEQYLITCVNDLFSFKSPALRLCDSLEKSETKFDQLTNNLCDISGDCLKIIPTFILFEAIRCISKCIFYPLSCEEAQFDASLVNKMVVIAAFHVSTLLVKKEQQFINYRNWSELLSAFGESIREKEISKFYGGFKSAALSVIFLLFFAFYTKLTDFVDEKDSTLTCLTLLSLVANLRSFLRHFAFHKTFVTITLMTTLANAFLKSHLTERGIVVFETIDLLVFLLFVLKKRKQIDRVQFYRLILPLFSLKLWFQLTVNILKDANNFKPLLSSVVPTFITAAITPKLTNVWILLAFGTQLNCFQLEMFTSKNIITATLLIMVYLTFLKTKWKWKFIASLAAIVSIACLAFSAQHNGFNPMQVNKSQFNRQVIEWDSIYELCYRKKDLKSIEKCFNLRDNVVINVEALVKSIRIINHRNIIKQLIASIPLSLMREKLTCFLGITAQHTDSEQLFNKCSLQNWDIYELELLATVSTTDTSLRLKCTQNNWELITELHEGNVYNLLFAMTDVASVTGRLLNVTCSSCWRTARPTFY